MLFNVSQNVRPGLLHCWKLEISICVISNRVAILSQGVLKIGSIPDVYGLTLKSPAQGVRSQPACVDMCRCQSIDLL